jgi:hypothetical protein
MFERQYRDMSSLDLDREGSLEFEWRRLYEASIVARVRVDRAEALKARIMAKLERLEEAMLAQHAGKSDGEAHEQALPEC